MEFDLFTNVLMIGVVNLKPLQGLSNITKRIIIKLNRLTCKNKMQKIVNVLAVSSAVVSLAVVGSGLYVYVNRGAIIDNVKSQALEAVLGGLGGLGGGLGGASVPSLEGGLPDGANDLSPSPQASGLSGPSISPSTPTF
jgi:hypothetical protein